MPVEDRHQALGSFSLTMTPDTPPGVLHPIVRGVGDKRGLFGHILFTPTWVPLHGQSDANMLGLSRFTGVVMEMDFGEGEPTTIRGPSLTHWLGGDGGKGAIIGLSKTFSMAISLTDATLTDWINAILPPSVQLGSITEPDTPPGGLLTYTAYMQTPREVIEEVLNLWFETEYRVNPNGTLDVGPPHVLWPTNPFYSMRDRFDRSPSTTALGTAETGQTWTAVTGTWGIDVNQNAYLVSTTQHALVRIDCGSAAFSASVDVELTAAADRTARGLAFKIIDANNFLLLQFIDTVTTDRRLVLQKRVAGTYSDLAITGDGHFTPDELVNVKVTVEQGLINVYSGGVRIMTYTMSAAEFATFGASTQVGMFVHAEASADDGLGRFDNFLVDDHSQRPTAIAVRRKSGRDPGIDGLATTNLRTHVDGSEYVTRYAVMTHSAIGEIPLGFANVSTPLKYYDLFGNPVEAVSAEPTPALLEGMEHAIANQLAAQGPKITDKITLGTDDYDVEGIVRPGDCVYIYDPVRGIVDLSNTVFFRGEVTHPMVLRLFALTWPIRQGMGVYYRNEAGVYTDLTNWVEWEDSDTGADTGGEEGLTDLERKLKIFEAATRFDR